MFLWSLSDVLFGTNNQILIIIVFMDKFLILCSISNENQPMKYTRNWKKKIYWLSKKYDVALRNTCQNLIFLDNFLFLFYVCDVDGVASLKLSESLLVSLATFIVTYFSTQTWIWISLDYQLLEYLRSVFQNTAGVMFIIQYTYITNICFMLKS